MVEKPRYAGRSILEMLWAELDEAYAHYATIHQGHRMSSAMARGVAQGLAIAIAIMESPYEPNTGSVKRQAQQRYREGTG